MGNPITWQNVNQGDASTAWRAMDSAQKSINGAFDGLTGVIKEREAIDAGNVVNQGKNNTNAYLNQVAELGKTPEALQAKIADGSLDRLRASFGMNIDQAATRGAADALLSTRYAQVEAATKHGHAMADGRSHPFMQAYKVASLKGDKEGMAIADAAYTAAGGRDLPGLVVFADQRNQEMELRGRATAKFGWEGETQADNMLTSANQRKNADKNADSSRISANASVVSAGAAVSNAKTARDSLTGVLQERANELVLKAGAGMATLNSNLINSPEGKKLINDRIAGMKDPDEQKAAARIVQQLPSDARAGDVDTLLQTISKPGFWGTLAGKGTSDDEIIKSFETVYNQGKNDKGATATLKSRKALYNSLAAQGTDTAASYGDLLDRSMGVSTQSVATAPVVVTPAAIVPPTQQPVTAQVATRTSPAVAERDAQINTFNRTVGMANSRRQGIQATGAKDVTDNFDTNLSVLKAVTPGTTKSDMRNALKWVSQMSDAGLLSNAQLKQVREARLKAGM